MKTKSIAIKPVSASAIKNVTNQLVVKNYSHYHKEDRRYD